MSSSPFIIRPAQTSDAEAIHALILELAEFEQLSHEVSATPHETAQALFGPQPQAEALVAVNSGNSLIGFALFYPFYSTFAGRCGLYLEDLYVQPNWRRQGVGRALLQSFLQVAQERGCPKAEWRVLDWNEPAIRFYQALGATLLHDWRPVRHPLRNHLG